MSRPNKVARFAVTLTIIFATAFGKIGFVKDQSMDATFPPPVFRQDPSIPEGHLRPLGWQRRPDGPVPEVEEMPNTREFYNDYVRISKPVVLRNGITSAPALTLWEKDDYLQTKYGKVNVTVTVKVMRRKDEVQTAKHVMKLKKFLYDYMYEDWYLASIVPHELMQDLPLPKCLRCGTLSNSLQEAELWMSSGGTSSRLHSHDDHNLHCVLFGRRDFILIEAQFKQNFAYQADFEGSLGGHSKLDMEMVNAFKYRNILMTPWIYSTLYPGDCIFIPAGYLHQVRSYGRSLSMTVLFAPTLTFDDDGCRLEEEEFRPLSDVTFTWTIFEGQPQLSNWKLNAESLRNLLLVQMGSKLSLTFDKFAHFYEAAMQVVWLTKFAMSGNAPETASSERESTADNESNNGDVSTHSHVPYGNTIIEQESWRTENLGYESSQASAIPRIPLWNTDEILLNRLREDLARKDVELESNAEGQITKLIYKREKLKQDMRRNYRNPYKVYKCDTMESARDYVSSFLEFIEDFKKRCPPGGVMLPGACAEARQNGACDSEVIFKHQSVNSNIFITVCKEDTNNRTFHFKKTVKVFDFRRAEIDCWLDLNESDSFPLLYLCEWDGTSVYMYSEAIHLSVMLEDIIKQHTLEVTLRRPFSLYIFHQLLCIIQEIHNKDWTHRDISGHNVLFTTDEMKVGKLKVVDFGRADKRSERSVHQQNEKPKLNYTGIKHDIVNATKLFTDLYCDNALAEFQTLFPQMKDKTIYSAIQKQVQITEEQKVELKKLIEIVYATIEDEKQDFGNISPILRCIENTCAEVVWKHVMMKAVEYLFPLVGIATYETPWDGDGEETEPVHLLHGNTSSTTESSEQQTLNELTLETALETLKTEHPELLYPFSLCMFQRQLKDLQNLHGEKKLANFISATIMLMESPVRVAFQTRDQDSDFSTSGVKGDILSVIRNLYNIYKGAECYKENDTLESDIKNGNIEKTLETDKDKHIWHLISLAYESIEDERKQGFGDIAPIIEETEQYIFLYDKTKTLQSEEVLTAMPTSAISLSDLNPSVPEMDTMENNHTLEPREQNPRPVLESGIPAPPLPPPSMLRVRPLRQPNPDQNGQGTELDNLRGGNNTLDLTSRVASLSVQSEIQEGEANAQ